LRENDADRKSRVDNRVKVLRLKEGVDYELRLVGTGHGRMDYSIGFMDDEGNYNDLRRFENVKINWKTVIDTTAAVSDESVLNIDEDGEGKYDLKLRAGENGYGEEAGRGWLTFVIIVSSVLLLLGIAIAIVWKKKGKVK